MAQIGSPRPNDCGKAEESMNDTHDEDSEPKRSKRARRRGQSLVEFALILPILLAFVGASVDMARLFQAWITIESATRDAAESAASRSVNSTQARDHARTTLCLQTRNLAGFTPSANPAPDDIRKCISPSTTITAFSCSATSNGATGLNPIVTVTVQASLPFKMLFHYPLITHDQTWTFTSTQTYSIVLNRGTTGAMLVCP
jgi:Flp pilus assembly protein TadG